jgi:transposase
LKSKRNEQVFVLQQAELELFQKLDNEDYLDLYYADGSHFSLTPSVRYAWQKKGEEILLPSSRATALSVFGILSRKCDLHAQMFEGTLNSEKIIGIFDEFATTITKQTIVVIDNAPVHHSKAFEVKIEEWKKQDLYLYFLPPYSPELNNIEILWRFIKYDWLPLGAYIDFKTLKNNLTEIIQNVGTKYNINFL